MLQHGNSGRTTCNSFISATVLLYFNKTLSSLFWDISTLSPTAQQMFCRISASLMIALDEKYEGLSELNITNRFLVVVSRYLVPHSHNRKIAHRNLSTQLEFNVLIFPLVIILVSSRLVKLLSIASSQHFSCLYANWISSFWFGYFVHNYSTVSLFDLTT